MKILYFTRDFGAENIEFARKNGLTMRNAAAQETGANVEPCDYVYGDDTPENYRAAYPVYTLPESNAWNEELQAELETLKAENEQLQTKYEQQNKVIAQYENETNALKSALDEAQAKIADLEAKLSEQPEGKQQTEPKKGKGE